MPAATWCKWQASKSFWTLQGEEVKSTDHYKTKVKKNYIYIKKEKERPLEIIILSFVK